MQIHFQGVTLEIVKGDIAKQKDCEAVVNASHADYKPDGGVSSAIHEGAGPDLYVHCKLLAPLKFAQPVMTSAFNLPNKCIIHCIGPQFGTLNADKILADCYINCLNAADRSYLTSVAFPAISTGAMGFPVREAAHTALNAIMDHAHKLKHTKLIRVVLLDQTTLNLFQNSCVKLMWTKRIAADTLSVH